MSNAEQPKRSNVEPPDRDYQRAVLVLRGSLMRTRSGRLTWHVRNGREYAYEVDLNTGNLEIGSEDNDGAAPYDFQIFGPAPAYGLIYRLSTRTNVDVRDEIRELYGLAARQVSGVDSTLDGLISELADDDLPF